MIRKLPPQRPAPASAPPPGEVPSAPARADAPGLREAGRAPSAAPAPVPPSVPAAAPAAADLERVGLEGPARAPLAPPASREPLRADGTCSPLGARFAQLRPATSPPAVAKDPAGAPAAAHGQGGGPLAPLRSWLQRLTAPLPELRRGEAYIADADAHVVRQKKLGGGVNGSFVVHLSNGAKGVWKPSAHEDMRPLRSCIEEDHQARREAAAYAVDRWLSHYAGVPPTVYRDLGGEAGALMEFVPASASVTVREQASRALEGPAHEDYRRMAIFDHIIGNLDRHSGNWLVGEEGRLVPIDHGLAFPLQNGDPGGHKFFFVKPFPLRPDELSRLREFLSHRQEIRAELGALLAPEAVEALFERVEQMIEQGATNKDWRGGGSSFEKYLDAQAAAGAAG